MCASVSYQSWLFPGLSSSLRAAVTVRAAQTTASPRRALGLAHFRQAQQGRVLGTIVHANSAKFCHHEALAQLFGPCCKDGTWRLSFWKRCKRWTSNSEVWGFPHAVLATWVCAHKVQILAIFRGTILRSSPFFCIWTAGANQPDSFPPPKPDAPQNPPRSLEPSEFWSCPST